MSEHQSYIILAQDLDSDQCEWMVETGANARDRAKQQLARWIKRDGRWVGHIREVSDRVEFRLEA